MGDGLQEYWDRRAASHKTVYKNEEFYTVTEVPFYYHRRELLLKRISSFFENSKMNETLRVLDFGCGDGYYSIYLSNKFANLLLHGSDLSRNFIEEAVEKAQQKGVVCVFQQADSIIPFKVPFDVIICIAVMAHISQEQLEKIVTEFEHHLVKGGKVILFEQTGLKSRNGTMSSRRSEDFYINLFKSQNFTLVSRELLAFPFFTSMSRNTRKVFSLLASLLHRLGLKRLAGYIRDPNSTLFLKYWEVLLELSKAFDRYLTPSDGNTIFIFQKKL